MGIDRNESRRFGGASGGYRRAKSPLILTGMDDIDALLKELPVVVANRAARSGLTKGVRLAAKKIRSQIPSRYKDARKAIGHSVRMDKDGPHKGTTQAKAGTAVGKKKTGRKNLPKSRGKGQKGIGIHPANLHWFILGTKDRYIRKGVNKGKWTGRMTRTGEPLFKNIVRNAVSSSRSEIMEVTRNGILDAMEREVQKLARRGTR